MRVFATRRRGTNLRGRRLSCVCSRLVGMKRRLYATGDFHAWSRVLVARLHDPWAEEKEATRSLILLCCWQVSATKDLNVTLPESFSSLSSSFVGDIVLKTEAQSSELWKRT